MLILLIFSLFAHNSLSRKDSRHYKCHVENASEVSGSVRRLNIFLQAPGIAATTGKLSRTQEVITLECFSHQSPVQVNLLYLEKMHGGQTVKKHTLQSRKAVTSAERKPAIRHTCVLLKHHREKFQRKFILREKVFLKGLSNCVVTAKLPKRKVFAKGLTVPHVHQEKQTSEKGIPSTNDKDMLNRQKLSITKRVFIPCILLAFAISFCCIVFVTYETPCLTEAYQQDRDVKRSKTIFIHETYP